MSKLTSDSLLSYTTSFPLPPVISFLVNHIVVSKQLTEKRKVNNIETHLLFNDLEKTYYTVSLQKFLKSKT
jgi:hypothetical protein